jgi:hypothetical protein
MKKIVLIIILLTALAKTATGQIEFGTVTIERASPSLKSFFHNASRVFVGYAGVAMTTFFVLIDEKAVYAIPLSSSTCVYGIGKLQKYNGKFWATTLAGYAIAIPMIIGFNYCQTHDNVSRTTMDFFGFGMFLLPPVFCNFGFNVSTTNKKEVLKNHFQQNDNPLDKNFHKRTPADAEFRFYIPLFTYRF